MKTIINPRLAKFFSISAIALFSVILVVSFIIFLRGDNKYFLLFMGSIVLLMNAIGTYKAMVYSQIKGVTEYWDTDWIMFDPIYSPYYWYEYIAWPFVYGWAGIKFLFNNFVKGIFFIVGVLLSIAFILLPVFLISLWAHQIKYLGSQNLEYLYLAITLCVISFLVSLILPQKWKNSFNFN